MNILSNYIDKIIKDYNLKNVEPEVRYFGLNNWHEASGSKKAIILNEDIFIITKILVEGYGSVANIMTNDFVKLETQNRIIDLKPFTKTAINGTLATIEANFLQIIENDLKINYDATNFSIPTPGTNLKTAYIEYIKLINKN